MRLRTLRRRLKGTRGQELIELMIVTPILLLTVAAIFDFAVLFRAWNVVTNAAREGARVGVLPSYSCNTGTPTDVQSRVNTYMLASGFSDPSAYQVQMQVQDLDPSAATFDVCRVRVAMNQQLPSLSIFGQAFFGGGFGTIPLAAMAEMRTEAQSPPTP